jgi:nucleotide-binding universal stress UspA family protein
MRNEIVVGLDDSPSSKAALQWAAQQARSTGAVLRAVHALDWPYGPESDVTRQSANAKYPTHQGVEDAYRQAITAVFDAVSPGPDWSLKFAKGNAGEVLVMQSQDADLLVVGTREHVGLGRLLLGSVSHYCLTHASCPVVAVPTRARARGPADAADAGGAS